MQSGICFLRIDPNVRGWVWQIFRVGEEDTPIEKSAVVYLDPDQARSADQAALGKSCLELGQHRSGLNVTRGST